jgi:hypothetical protein
MAVIPAPKNPSCVAGSVSCGCGADAPPPTPLAAVRLATMGPPRAAAAAAARSLIAPSCLRRGATPSLAAFPRERAFAAQRLGALCGARSPVEVSMFVPGRTRRQAPVLRSSLVRRRRATAESLDDALKKPTCSFSCNRPPLTVHTGVQRIPARHNAPRTSLQPKGSGRHTRRTATRRDRRAILPGDLVGDPRVGGWRAGEICLCECRGGGAV